LNIHINGQKVNFELENGERTAADVMAGIMKWSTENGRVMRSCRIGEKVFYGENDTLSGMSIDKIKDVFFEVISPQEFALEALADVQIFFRGLSGPKGFDRKDLLETLNWCGNVITKAKRVLGLDFNRPFMDTTAAAEINKLSKFLEALRKKEPKSSDIFNEFVAAGLSAGLLEKITEKLIEDGRHKLSGKDPSALPTPAEIIKKLMASQMELPEISKRIEKLTLELHTGGDVSAMNRLNEVSEQLTSMIHNLQLADAAVPAAFSEIRTAEDHSISEELMSLTEIFKRIVGSFDTKDTVLLCDILEYELTPRLNTLNSIMELLIRRLREDAN
jgi:hypothetical protein